jgi:hypothetical protein
VDRARSTHILRTVLLLLGRDGIGVPVPSSSATVGVRYRERGHERRDDRFELRVSAGERAVLAAAASRSGQTLAAYLVEAGLEKAEHRTAPVGEVHREMLADLYRLTGEVNRVRTHLGQAVSGLDCDGATGPDLERAVGYCMRVVQRIDEAAQLVRRRLS